MAVNYSQGQGQAVVDEWQAQPRALLDQLMQQLPLSIRVAAFAPLLHLDVRLEGV